jgi:capsular polysaccharide transport system ATP-binding protein
MLLEKPVEGWSLADGMLSVEHISKVYETRHGPYQVFDDVSFVLPRGKNLGILGRNGAGKSTMIRLLSGAERPTKGVIHRGMSVSWPLAFGGAFAAHLTGLDNLKFVCRIYGIDYKPLIPFVEDFTELGSFLREPVMHYSHGMTTRLAFALSMAIEFDCFLIDEAMIVGDARFHARCHYELFEKRKDRSFILVSHDADTIKRYCQAAVVLHDGRLHEFPTVDDAYGYYLASLARKPEEIEHWRM